jgi:hypothetical protein
VLVMTCYGFTADRFVSVMASAFGASSPPRGLFAINNAPVTRVFEMLLFAPIFESLILIAAIELFTWLGAPKWAQIAYGTLLIGFLHSISWPPWGFIVAPAFAIQGIAYVIWRRTSRKTAYLIVACIHLLLNLIPAIPVIAYLSRYG